LRIILAATLLVICSASADAQVFYQYPGAPTVEPKHFDAGGYLSGGDNLFRFGGSGRLGLARYWDVGFEALVESQDSSWRGGAGGDVRYQLFPNTDKLPLDLAADAGFGFVSGDGVTIYQTPIGAVVSSPLRTDNGTVITPYLGIYAVYVRVKVKVTGVPDATNNAVEAMLRGGASVRFGEKLELYGTLQLGPDDLASIGINYSL